MDENDLNRSKERAGDSGQPRTILVVDDDDQVRSLAQRVLEQYGYRVLVAGNPDSAEERFDQAKGKVDLLLTDVVMPGGDGPDLYRRLRTKRRLRVLYMSGYTHTLNPRRHWLEGSSDYLEKPFAPEQLVKKVDEVFALPLEKAVGKMTILVVDDDESVLKFTARVLQDEGYAIFAASSPDEAQGIIDKHKGEIDLLLTDVVLPEGDGPYLYERILEKQPVKVLYMSGYTHTLSGRKHLLEGNPEFLQKPFSSKQLVNRVREVLLNPDL